MNLDLLERFKVKILTLTEKKKSGLKMVCGLGLAQSVLRFAFPAYILQAGFPNTEKIVSTDVQAMILVMFVLIGVAGIITTYGLLTGARWGYTGTIALSMVTIMFDAWAMAAVQTTALLGLILPVVFIAYLIANRTDFPDEVRTLEGAGGIRN
jgi:hypothetical protein